MVTPSVLADFCTSERPGVYTDHLSLQQQTSPNVSILRQTTSVSHPEVCLHIGWGGLCSWLWFRSRPCETMVLLVTYSQMRALWAVASSDKLALRKLGAEL